MVELSKKTQLVLNKVKQELASKTLTFGDFIQLEVFCLEKPNITYLGLLEKVEKYLPISINTTELEARELLEIYQSYKNIVDRQFSPLIIKLYPNLCITIRLKEIVYDSCWYLPFFVKLRQEIKKEEYLEFQGWEEVLLVPALLGATKISITSIDIKQIKEYYLREKLKTKHISKIYHNLAEVAISSREMNWITMTTEQLLNEKVKLEQSNLFGRSVLLRKLEDEYKI
jgi:hypothetical protein